MATLDPVWSTAAELSRAFGARTLSPVDTVEALLDRIARRNPALHAFIAVYDQDARLAAEAADKAIRAGQRVGPLHGVPIALKDLVDGRDVLARDYLSTLAKREDHKRAFAAALTGIDALLTPTTLTPPIPVASVDQSRTAAHFTRGGNYLGLCGLAVPNGFTVEGLPTSLQILCHPGDEAMALRIGWAYEQATGWRERRPPEPQ